MDFARAQPILRASQLGYRGERLDRRVRYWTAQVLAFALLIGGIAIPGAFLARAFVERMPVHIRTAILDVAVIAGGVVMISTAVRQISG
jgi:hypothetical protein